MRRGILFVCGLAAAFPGGLCLPASAGNACAASCSSGLKLNEIQIIGTAESYKQRPSKGLLSLIRLGGEEGAETLNYGEPPIADQLDGGARSLEFDIVYDPNGGLFKDPAGASMADEVLDPKYVAAMGVPGFKVMHVPDVDFRSSCLLLKDCLDEVADWSRRHPGHIPIIVLLHANDRRTPMPGATRPLPFDAAAMDTLDGDIRRIFPADGLITPDMVQGGAATLREAVLAHHWPTLAAARGKIMFVLDNDADKIGLYQGARHNLEGRAMFVTADEASPLAAVVCIDDPLKDAARIAADVKAGFIVRTRADENAVEARASDAARRTEAFTSGAQIVATDFPIADATIGAYKVSITDNPRDTDKSADFIALPAAEVQTATVH
ncbi:MAG TPA: Ca2+-dependent phosphoinositide-specific phospholipase C [Rhizomicrobium sp.]|jgi:hypothetical protein|nr:Ca2+-dependent phosphoinositide-specific phospholipase C [Rhizomicrobium sp.]